MELKTFYEKGNKMTKPYIICHMMASIDGRIDCAMTAQLRGNAEYYQTLSEINVPSTLSGRVTAETEMGSRGNFQCSDPHPFGKVGFSKAADAEGYEIITDTKGRLMWDDNEGSLKPFLVITSEDASKEYLDYLTNQHISWIAAGKNKIDLKKAMDILGTEFGVKRLGIVGGAKINGGFLNAGLLDEISLVIGPGIDGREGMPGVFDGLQMNTPVTHLQLKSVKQYGDGAVWLRYSL